MNLKGCLFKQQQKMKRIKKQKDKPKIYGCQHSLHRLIHRPGGVFLLATVAVEDYAHCPKPGTLKRYVMTVIK